MPKWGREGAEEGGGEDFLGCVEVGLYSQKLGGKWPSSGCKDREGGRGNFLLWNIIF